MLKNIFLIILIFSTLYFLGQMKNPLPSIASENNDLDEKRFSVSIKNKNMLETLKILSEKTGYEFEINTVPDNVRINEILNNVTLQEAINRMLRKYNHFEIWDENARKVTMYIFDGPSPTVTITGKRHLFDQATRTINK